MKHLGIITDPNPFVEFPVLVEASALYMSEFRYNHWTSVCVNYKPNVKFLRLRKLIYFFATLATIPCLICSNCRPPCRGDTTLGMYLEPSAIALTLNSSYRVKFYYTPYCDIDPKSESNCGFKKIIRNALHDPMTIYADRLFKWQNATFMTGLNANVQRLIQSGFKNELQFKAPNEKRVRAGIPRPKFNDPTYSLLNFGMRHELKE